MSINPYNLCPPPIPPSCEATGRRTHHRCAVFFADLNTAYIELACCSIYEKNRVWLKMILNQTLFEYVIIYWSIICSECILRGNLWTNRCNSTADSNFLCRLSDAFNFVSWSIQWIVYLWNSLIQDVLISFNFFRISIDLFELTLFANVILFF